MDSGAAPGDFAVVLRRLRESRSLTQEELAERAGLTAKAIGALERGERRRPYPHTVRSIADGLALDDDERSALVAAVPSRDAGPRVVSASSVAQVAGSAASSSAPEMPATTEADAGHAPSASPAPSLVPSAAPPTPTTLLIGRESDLDALSTLVRSGSHRLVTITGPGGVGKTRLAMELLHREAPQFPGGARAVDLAAVREPALVVPRIAAALGMPEAVAADPIDALVAHLTGVSVLLVLDNLEQLTGAAPLLADLVARCPDLVVVATSRAALRVRAESEVVLGPLATPAHDDLATVASSPAVALLLERAAAAGSRTAVTEHDAATLAAICRRLDGIPLALELAAPGLRLLSPSTLLTRLEQTGLGAGSPGLGTGPRDLPDRHRTMATVLDWSMDLLEPEEVDLLTRLAVFSGGFSLDDVVPVTSDNEGADVLPSLGALVDQSLVLRVPAPDDQPRFRLLEPVRQFAMQRLHESGSATATADRHAAHFHKRATTFRDPLQGPGLAVALDRLEADHANLRSAYLRLLELDRDGDAAEIVGNLWLYLALRGHAREGLAWLDRIGPGASDVARCRALTGRLGLLMVTGDVEGMRHDTDEAVTLVRRVGDPAVTCEILLLAGQGAVFARALPEAEGLLAGAAVAASESGRTWVAAHAVLAQGLLALTAGDLATAGVVLAEGVATAREVGNPFTLATALNINATRTELLGDEPVTAALLGEAVALSLAARLSWTLGYSLPALASLAQRVGDPASAAWLFGAGASISAADAVDPAFPVSRALSDRGLDATRAALGEREFIREWDAGRVASDAEIQARAAMVMTRAGGGRSA